MRPLNVVIPAATLALLAWGSLLASEGPVFANPGNNDLRHDDPSTSSSASAPAATTSATRAKSAPVDPAGPRRDDRYQLCASDVIAIAFPLTPEFNQIVTLGPDGFATLSGAGDVHLEGLTAEESIDAIRKAYAGLLHEPIVAVELKDFNKPYFIVTGKVNHPGKYDLRGETSAAQGIAVAGGFNDESRHSQVLLFHRVSDDWYAVTPINLKRILQGRDVNEDPILRPGDMLVVPQNTLSKIRKYIPSSGIGAYYQP